MPEIKLYTYDQTDKYHIDEVLINMGGALPMFVIAQALTVQKVLAKNSPDYICPIKIAEGGFNNGFFGSEKIFNWAPHGHVNLVWSMVQFLYRFSEMLYNKESKTIIGFDSDKIQELL